MFLLFFWKGAGRFAPLMAALGAIAGLVVWSVVHAAKGLEGPFIGIGVSLVGGVGLFFVARRAYERSGLVRYDAQNDRPVVYGQTSGHFWFIPTTAWAVIIGLAGLVIAAASYRA